MPAPKKKLGTNARGYDKSHRAKRAWWKPRVERGEVECHAAICLVERDGGTRFIAPGSEWDLGHTADRLTWTGPEHRRCNRSEGATRGNGMRNKKRTLPRSRDW